MLDIVSITDGLDLGTADSVVMKAGNIISTQEGTLDYAPNFGVDLKFFLFSSIRIQKESFKAHLVERLAFNQVNVNEIIEEFNSLYMGLVFDVTGANTDAIGVSEIKVSGNLITEDGEVITTDGSNPIGV